MSLKKIKGLKFPDEYLTRFFLKISYLKKKGVLLSLVVEMEITYHYSLIIIIK